MNLSVHHFAVNSTIWCWLTTQVKTQHVSVNAAVCFFLVNLGQTSFFIIYSTYKACDKLCVDLSTVYHGMMDGWNDGWMDGWMALCTKTVGRLPRLPSCMSDKIPLMGSPNMTTQSSAALIAALYLEDLHSKARNGPQKRVLTPPPPLYLD